VDNYPKIVQRKSEEEQEGQDGYREVICLAPLLGGAKNEEKWRNPDGLEVPKKAMRATMEGVIGVDDESSIEETPNSVANQQDTWETNKQKLKERRPGMMTSKTLWRREPT
jgi:hypothetical protein